MKSSFQSENFNHKMRERTLDKMEKLYEGKSKIVFSGEEAGTCIIKYKDTATAGNGLKKEDLPGDRKSVV